MDSLIKTLIKRDGLSPDEALEIIQDLRDRFEEGENPEELLYEIGLEPDYIFDLMEPSLDEFTIKDLGHLDLDDSVGFDDEDMDGEL